MATPLDEFFAICAGAAAQRRLTPVVVAVRDPVTGAVKFRSTPGAFEDQALRAAVLERFRGAPVDAPEGGGWDTEWP